MSVQFKVDGFKEIEQALATLKAGTAKGVARRAMKKELKPVADMANAFWPGSDDKAFLITSRVKGSQPQPQKGRNILNMLVGSSEPHAHLLEWGTGPRSQSTTGRFTGSVAPIPMLTPSWDAHKDQILRGLGKRLWEEIAKTQARLAKG